ncbi:hypothetical protein TWF696_005920 [Orbilia brochopaga]|uniref:Uncharacterized protein n=1 Tax=Orbilia brochopaga TaxID=3140254 RepID=A0AAV9UXY3_9PEZI
MSTIRIYRDPPEQRVRKSIARRSRDQRAFTNLTNEVKPPSSKPRAPDNPALPYIAYIFQELDAHLAYEISSRILSREFTKEWPQVFKHLLRELHIRMVFDKTLVTSVQPFSFLDPSDVAELGLADLKRLHVYALSKERDQPFYTANARVYPWHVALFATLDSMGIKPENWSGLQALRGPEFGERVLSCEEPIKVEVREWRNIAVKMMDGVKPQTLEHCYKWHAMLALTAFQKWCLQHGWKTERGVWIPDSFGPLPVLWLNEAEIKDGVHDSDDIFYLN